MANQDHINILKQGLDSWAQWRRKFPELEPDLSYFGHNHSDFEGVCFSRQLNRNNADFEGVDLSNAQLCGLRMGGADLSGAKLKNANLSHVWGKVEFDEAILEGAILNNGKFNKSSFIRTNLNNANLNNAELMNADFYEASLVESNLQGAQLINADFRGADLTGANLSGADLYSANLSHANFSGANLTNADLSKALLIDTNFEGANLSSCLIYGVSAWNIKTNNQTNQNNLRITPKDESIITVDNLEVAQFIYLMLNNQKIRDVINTISNKAVLILGKFGTRLSNLDAIRVKLRELGFLPILFDFKPPHEKATGETIKVLAGLSKFVIADLTEPRSLPLELDAIVSNYPTLPVHLLLQDGEQTFSMADQVISYQTISGISRYNDINEILDNFEQLILVPMEKWKHDNKDKIEEMLKKLL